jgi:hypothetical protein
VQYPQFSNPGLYAQAVRHLSIADITAPEALQFGHSSFTSAQGGYAFSRAFLQSLGAFSSPEKSHEEG